MTRALWTKIGIQDAGSDDENARSAVLEPNVKILWKDFRKMAFNFRSTALFVMPRVQFLCVNPNHQNGARSRADLRRCGRSWTNCNIFSLTKTPKVHLLFQPSISVLKCSTCMIAGLELVCQLSDFLQRVMSTCIVFPLSVPEMPVDILQQTISEASAFD